MESLLGLTEKEGGRERPRLISDHEISSAFQISNDLGHDSARFLLWFFIFPILAVSKKSTLFTYGIFTHSSIFHPHVRAKCVGLVLICWKTVSNEIGMSQGNSYFSFHLILSSFAVFKHRDGASVCDHILGCRKGFLAQPANNEPTIPRFPNMMACATLFTSKKFQHRINHYSLLQ